MKILRLDPSIVVLIIVALALSLGQNAIPSWARYVTQVATAGSLAAIGVVILLRCGLLSFGQSLFFFVGAYADALAFRCLGISDAVLMIVVGAVLSGVLALCLGAFISHYRGIFFSMLTLAITMIAYGLAIKVALFGRSDGLNLTGVTFFGTRYRGSAYETATFLLCVWTWALASIGASFFLRSKFGKLLDAIQDNEVRVEYLGRSARMCIVGAYVIAAILASIGGSLVGLAARHVDPGFAYWTTAGDFIFVALLSGQGNVLSPFFGSLILEFLRTLASASFPEKWQLALGTAMVLIVLFLPAGLEGFAVRILRRMMPSRRGMRRDVGAEAAH